LEGNEISFVQVFWVVMLCSDVVGYQYFRGSCCLRLPLWRCRQHGSITQKTTTYYSSSWNQLVRLLLFSIKYVTRIRLQSISLQFWKKRQKKFY